MIEGIKSVFRGGVLLSVLIGAASGLAAGVVMLAILKSIAPARGSADPNAGIELCLAGYPTDNSTDTRGVAITYPGGTLAYCALFRVSVEGWSARK